MASIEIDGQPFEVENGKMIIEVADEAGIHIPRFCYHKKLSVAANCRMCLVEIENGRKTVPACATPITNGMKVFTKSKEAIRSQKAVMEFLLINHPLDCPICDQGGECELQDVSMGYGADASQFVETKRAVDNDDLGPLIATEMTRCIHCTRCVRFGDEIAGVRELGGVGRGEDMQISTYIQHSLTSEISGNIIDLCPVGALTSKPYRFTARAWEMTQHASIAPHDCLGSNVYLHVRRNELMRVVPHENEAINETWLSDRDRFSYLGMNHPSRATSPMIKRNGQWESVDWNTALTFAQEGIRRVIETHGPEQFAALASSSSTLEELYLLQKLMRAKGVNNLDHRLHQTDFRDDTGQPNMPQSTLPFADIETQTAIVIVGCNISREVPLASVRVRKAALAGAEIYALNPIDYDYHFAVVGKSIVAALDIPTQLAKLLLALAGDMSRLSIPLQKLVIGLTVEPEIQKMAKALCAEKAVIITGALCENHPQAALIRLLITEIKALSGAKGVHFTTGANTAGAWLAGMLPHRTIAGVTVDAPGLDAHAAIAAKLKGYLLLSAEPSFDFVNPAKARQSMLSAEFVVVLSAFFSETMHDYANVVLPMAPYSETSGTYINIDHRWQSFRGALAPKGEARPAWKILRVLGNLLDCDGFSYESTDAVLEEIKSAAALMNSREYVPIIPEALPVNRDVIARVGEWGLYRVDPIVRHADALNQCASADELSVHVHPETAEKMNLGEMATVSQGEIEVLLPITRNARVAKDVIWLQNALSLTVDLGDSFSAMTIKSA